MQKFLIMFASPSRIEAITPEKFPNSVVGLCLGMWQKLQLQNSQTAVQFWKHDRIYQDRFLWKPTVARHVDNEILGGSQDFASFKCRQ